MMRPGALVAFILLCGCLDPPQADAGAAESPPPSPEAKGPPMDAASSSFCTASTCDFPDDRFHEFLLYQPDTATIDVLVVPPVTPDAVPDAELARQAILQWSEGVQELAPRWLAQGLQVTPYVLGTDAVPPEALQDPEVIVFTAEANPLLLYGSGSAPEQAACSLVGQAPLRDATGLHRHGGTAVLAADCTSIGYLCVAVNTNFLLAGELQGVNRSIFLQDLVAHEVGHCLGNGHVGDALDFRANAVPVNDVMSYQHDDGRRHCVSSLNIRALENLYAPLLTGTAGQFAVGSSIALDPLQYAQVDCNHRANGHNRESQKPAGR